MTAQWRIIIILLIGLLSFEKTKGQSVTVLVKKSPEAIIKPGEKQTILVAVENHEDTAVQAQLSYTLPSPLRAVLQPRKVRIDSLGSKSFFFNFSVPPDCPAGKYSLYGKLSVNNKLYDSLSWTLEVSKVYDLDVVLKKVDPYVRAGDTINAQFMVINRGNHSEAVQLKSSDALIKGAKEFITVGAGETESIEVLAYTDPKIAYIAEKTIDLRIIHEETGQSEMDQRTIKVYPIRSVKSDPFHRLPMSVTYTYIVREENGQVQSSYQLGLNGRGSLDSSGKHQLEYFYVGPNQENTARLGLFSQWYVSYTNQGRWTFTTGERSYNASRLTDINRFGFGFEAQYTGNRSTYRVNTVRPRFNENFTQVSSGTGRVQFNDSMRFDWALTNKILSAGGVSTIGSAGIYFDNSRNFILGADIALSGSGGQNAGFAALYDLRYIGKDQRLTISNSMIAADENFEGYFSNSFLFNGGASYRWENIALGINGNINQLNPSLDTVFGASPYGTNLNPIISYKYGANNSINIQYSIREREDRGFVKKFHFEEEVLRLTWSHSFKNLMLAASYERGLTNNLLAGITENLNEAVLQANYAKGRKLNASGFFQVSRNNRFSTRNQTYYIYGVSLGTTIRDKFRISGQYQNQFFEDQLYTDRSRLDMRMGYQIHKYHNISVFANQALLFNFNNRSDFIAGLAYEMILNVPTQRVITFGALKGKVITPAGYSPSDILLFMEGNAAITDDDGAYVFNGLKPGNYRMQIDRSSLGIDLIPDTVMPLPVLIESAKTSELDLKIIKSGRIEGMLEIERTKGFVRSSKNEIRIPTIIIEISNGDETYLINNDKSGAFRYYGLKPGIWQVRILAGSWQKDLNISSMQQEVEVLSDGDATVTFQLKPKVQRIKFKSVK